MSVGYINSCPICNSTRLHPHFVSATEIEAFTCLNCNKHFKTKDVKQTAIKEPSAQMELPLFGGKP